MLLKQRRNQRNESQEEVLDIRKRLKEATASNYELLTGNVMLIIVGKYEDAYSCFTLYHKYKN
jgi:hypothetical protein